MSSALRRKAVARLRRASQVERRRRRALREDLQSALEAFDLRIDVAVLVPQVVAHDSFSRSSFMPR